MQAVYSPADQPATRWWMEAVGTGIFRLRNGNPDRGATPANVVLKTCVTTGDVTNQLLYVARYNWPN